MIKKLLFIVVCLISAKITSQKVKDEKLKISYEKKAIFNFLDSYNNYSSNDDVLKLDSKEKTLDSELFVEGVIYDQKKIGDTPNAVISQSVGVTIKNKEDILFHRIFNDLEKEDPNSKLQTSQRSNYAYYYPVANYLNLLFSDSNLEYDLRLFYIIKSEVHNDINDGYEKGVKGIEAFNNKNYDEGKKMFNEAVAIWEKALSEADFKNKKARINKTIAAALYKNLMQILPFIGRSNDAEKLIGEYATNIKGFGVFFAEGKRKMINTFQIYDMAEKEASKFSLSDIEIPSNLEPLTLNDNLYVSQSTIDLKTLLTGSWIGYYRTTDSSTKKKSECSKPKYSRMHFDAFGIHTSQIGSFETECKQKIDNEYVWKIQKNEDGFYYLRIGDVIEDFEGDFTDDFRILHLTKDLLILAGHTYVEGDTTSQSNLQFYRINLP